MKVIRSVVVGLLAGAAAAFVAALLRPRRPGGYDPWQAAAAADDHVPARGLGSE